MLANPEYQIAGSLITLKSIGEAFVKTAQATRADKGRRGHGIFATYQGGPGPDGGKECPCKPKGQTHRWPPHECEVLLYALLDKPFIRRRPHEGIIARCQRQVKDPKWLSLIKEIKGKDKP